MFQDAKKSFGQLFRQKTTLTADINTCDNKKNKPSLQQICYYENEN